MYPDPCGTWRRLCSQEQNNEQQPYFVPHGLYHPIPKNRSQRISLPEFVPQNPGGAVQNIYSRPMAKALKREINDHGGRGDHCKVIQKSQGVNEVLRRLFLQKNIDIEGSTKLGSGRYSKVITARQFKGNNPYNYKMIAIKIIDTEKVTREFKEKFLPREIDCWRQLNHPNLVRILGHYETLKYVFLSMEYGTKGDLLTHVQTYGPISEKQGRLWLRQILYGVGYMHSLGISHRDLKLENIIVFDDNLVKVGDFGFARKMDGFLSSTYCGSKSYSAPEILIGRPYSPFKSDVWSIGVIVMVTDTMPFRENVANMKIVESQKRRDYQYPRELGLSMNCIYTLNTMMTFDPKERPSLSQSLRLPFFFTDDNNRRAV